MLLLDKLDSSDDSEKEEFLPKVEPILSVTELSQTLKLHVESRFKDVRLRAEVSGVKRHTSGHWYFSLKDEGAVLDAVCWRGTHLNITLSDGLDVIVKGRVTTYPGRSKYQMVVESLELAGQGALLKMLMDRKEKLQKEGLFDQKRSLPPFPQKIGVITSATGAVIRDILHRIKERYPCSVVVWPVLVQGSGASEQVASAIRGFNSIKESERPDILIIARGGGSVEDLWAFNEEELVRAVFKSAIVTISAIGHETDVTLCDFVADKRAPTPTAAAEFATPVRSDLLGDLALLSGRYRTLMKNFIHQCTLSLKVQTKGLVDPKYYIEGLLLRLDDWSERLRRYPSILQNVEQRVSSLAQRLSKPSLLLDRLSDSLCKIEERKRRSFKMYFTFHEKNVTSYGFFLKEVSPKRLLDQGFCLIRRQGALLKTKEKLLKDLPTELTLQFSDGDVTVRAELSPEGPLSKHHPHA